MSPYLLFSVILFYFGLLILISKITSRKADNNSFFIGNRKSPWYVVAFGMIGASLSGVTFISVPGWVESSQFSYMQMVLGYLAGYLVIANVLMPLYYKMNLTSIYAYLDSRFGNATYKTGASFFLLSRLIGASFRLFLVASAIQLTIFDAWGIPFVITVVVTILLIWLYTFKGGIKTIIWTDTLQTISMLAALVVAIVLISRQMNMDFSEMIRVVRESEYSKLWFFDDWKSEYHFVKQFLGGMFIAIVMTGLDQDMMQKNLSCRNIREAKKNMYWMSIALVPVNLVFLSLGALLFIFATRFSIGIPEHTDMLFPLVATGGYLGSALGVFFMIGIVAAAYSSADSALTSLTTSFTIDILNGNKMGEQKLRKTRMRVHLMVSVLLLLIILVFRIVNDDNVVSAIFRVAGYTYGPLLGMYSFGILHKRNVKDRFVPVVALLSPVITYFINAYSEQLFWGYQFGFELLLVNGFLSYLGLWIISKKNNTSLENL